MRREDLVNPEHKLDSLLHLATFVGLRPSLSELCSISIKDEEDMGLSVNVSQWAEAEGYWILAFSNTSVFLG
jgi:hypothetical protein